MSRKLKAFMPGCGYTKQDWDEVSDPHAPTDAQWSEAKPFAEAFPELAAKIDEPLKASRGPQKAPIKEMISLRLDRDVLAAWRATGPGWQARMNDALRAALRRTDAG